MVAAANFLVIYKYANKPANGSREQGKTIRTYLDFQVGQRAKLVMWGVF